MLLREIFEITRAQEEALTEDSIERFDQLLEVRAGLIERLQEIAHEAPSATDEGDEELPENVIVFPFAPQGAANEDALALDTLLQGILDADLRNEAALQRKLQHLRGEIPAIEAERRGAARYAVAAPAAHFIDRAS